MFVLLYDLRQTRSSPAPFRRGSPEGSEARQAVDSAMMFSYKLYNNNDMYHDYFY